MKRRFAITLTVICIALSSLLSTSALGSFSEQLNDTEFAWFKQYGVDPIDITRVIKSYPNGADHLRSLVQQAKAYSFTPDQVKMNVKGLLDTPDSAFRGVYGQLSKDGTTYTMPNGMTAPNLLAKRMFGVPTVAEEDESGISLYAYSSNYRDVVDYSDQSGVFWLVKSETGYNQATAFVNLPYVTALSTSPDRPYMFFAVNNSTSSVIGDYGIVYYPNSGWHLFTYTLVWNSSQNKYDRTWWSSDTPLPSQYTGGSALYLQVQITNTSSTDSVTITLKDGNTFSTLFSRTVDFINNPFNSSLSNVNIYRQITMAQVLAGSTLNTNTGTHMANARFSNAYIYSPSGYWPWGINQTNDAYRKAPTLAQLATVTVNSYTKWNAENISIRFNVP